MYGIYANIGGIWMVNVTIYISIHGSYGYDQFPSADPMLFFVVAKLPQPIPPSDGAKLVRLKSCACPRGQAWPWRKKSVVRYC